MYAAGVSDGQEDLYLFLLPHYGTQGRAGAGVPQGSELDPRAIVHWRSECGRFAERRRVCDTRYVEKWLGVQLQSMMTDKASVATWEGVFEAASVEVLTDVAEVTDRLRRGAEELHIWDSRQRRNRVSPVARRHSGKRIGSTADLVGWSTRGRHDQVEGMLGRSRR
jgi:hypothetical protein